MVNPTYELNFVCDDDTIECKSTSMYLRFVVANIDKDSQRELGIFHALFDLRDEGELYSYEEDQHDLIREWFNEHLKRPARFATSKNPLYRGPHRAICWFKDSASEHLDWAWWMVAILENHQVPVQMLKAERVGYVVYEDEYQIVAEPFAEM
jgi:hypothetical protein